MPREDDRAIGHAGDKSECAGGGRTAGDRPERSQAESWREDAGFDRPTRHTDASGGVEVPAVEEVTNRGGWQGRGSNRQIRHLQAEAALGKATGRCGHADDEPDGSGVVKVSPARLQTLGVKTARAAETTLDAALRAVGRVEVDERRTHDVAPRFEGWIERLYVNATGDPVRKGQALFSVYSPELVSAQKELRIAEELQRSAVAADPAALDGAQRLAAAARERLRNWKVGAAAGKESANLVFSSPATGVVLEKKAVEGMRFMAGAVIYRIADLSTVWVIADVYEKDLARVRIGEAARVIIDAFPGNRFDARVTYLYPTLNAATRTTPVRLELKNQDGMLRPGMFAHVEIATAGSATRLTVPTSALIDTGERQVVLLVLGEGRYKPQPVKIGLRGRDAVEILDGLQVNDEVVVAANFLIDAESNLKAALATFTAPAAMAKAAPAYQAQGSLDSLDVSSNTLSVTHERIPALKWPAMTMDFGLASPEPVSYTHLTLPTSDLV